MKISTKLLFVMGIALVVLAAFALVAGELWPAFAGAVTGACALDAVRRDKRNLEREQKRLS